MDVKKIATVLCRQLSWPARSSVEGADAHFQNLISSLRVRSTPYKPADCLRRTHKANEHGAAYSSSGERLGALSNDGTGQSTTSQVVVLQETTISQWALCDGTAEGIKRGTRL